MTSPTLDPNRLDVHGRFYIPKNVWQRLPKSIPSAPGDSVRGRLTFDQSSGAVLKIHGHFSRWGPPAVPGIGQNIPTVLGSDGYSFWALYASRKTFTSGVDPQYAREHYAPQEVLTFAPGQDFNWEEDPRFLEDLEALRTTGITIKSKMHLQHWIGEGGVGREPGGDMTTVRFAPSPSSTYEEAGTRADLSFGHDTESVNSRFGFHVEQAAFLRISFEVPRPVVGSNGILQVARMMHGLVALSLHRSVPIERVTLHFDRADRDPLRARLYRQWRESEGASYASIPPQPAIGFDAIGELQGIVRWINCCEKYWLPILRVINRWRSSSAYLENKFNDVYVALESFARIKAGIRSAKRMPAMVAALRILARDQQCSGRGLQSLQSSLSDDDSFRRFREIVGDVNAWAKAMVRARGSIVIHPGMDGYSGTSGLELYPLFETGYLLTVLCLLNEAGISPSAGVDLCEALLAASVVKEPMWP